MKKDEYIVVSRLVSPVEFKMEPNGISYYRSEFVDLVNKKIEEGYEPLGGLLIVDGYAYQSMVLKNKDNF